LKNQIKMLGPKPGPAVSGASVPRVTVPQPSGAASNNRAPIPVSAAKPAQGSRINDAVRGELDKLLPELAAGIRAVADRK
jgi:hypothetical protein